jgi:hypothetical protein
VQRLQRLEDNERDATRFELELLAQVLEAAAVYMLAQVLFIAQVSQQGQNTFFGECGDGNQFGPARRFLFPTRVDGSLPQGGRVTRAVDKTPSVLDLEEIVKGKLNEEICLRLGQVQLVKVEIDG